MGAEFAAKPALPERGGVDTVTLRNSSFSYRGDGYSRRAQTPCVGGRSVVLPNAMQRPRPGRLRGAARFSIPLLARDLARLAKFAEELGTTKTALARDLILAGLEKLKRKGKEQ